MDLRKELLQSILNQSIVSEKCFLGLKSWAEELFTNANEEDLNAEEWTKYIKKIVPTYEEGEPSPTIEVAI